MPVATINPEATEHRDLKSAPPDGYVTLRRMPYGQYLHRQQMAMQLRIEARRGGGRDNTAGTMDMVQRKVTVYEFKECIVDHNLTNQDGQPLDFNNPSTFDFLDPRIGDEIGTYINELHQFDSLGNSQNGSSSSVEVDE